MRLLLLTALTMVAFAANSVINRLSLAEGDIGPANFALIRVLSGAIVLLLIARATAPARDQNQKVQWQSVLSLTAYLIGFSFAYVTLETGIGALILFGGVQLTMFASAIFAREPISTQRWIGSATALAGLIWLLAPGQVAPPVTGALLMGFAAIGWGVFSLMGRKVTDPLLATQTSFLWALPLVALIAFVIPDAEALTTSGVLLAILSGAVTSGLGYYLWYSILPKLDTVVASTAQLTVPAIVLPSSADRSNLWLSLAASGTGRLASPPWPGPATD